MSSARNGRAPTRRERRRARERAIVATTRALIDERGRRDVAVDEIARAARVNKALIYRSFDSKEEIFVLTVVDYLAELEARGAGLPGTADPVAALRQVCERYVGFCLDYPALGYTVNRSRLVLWNIRAPGRTTRARRESSWPGSAPMRTAWTTWSGCAGLAGSHARRAVTPAAGGWAMAGVECGGCGRRTSVTAGTVFDRTHTPLTVWFHACWLFATAKDGISAQHLQRTLEIGSYATAWGMLHRLRSVLVRPGRGRLSGSVEVDETFIGGEEAGLRGGRQRGKKVLTGIAVEVREPKGIGRCRMAVLADGSAESLHPFITGAVEPGARVITDGWNGYFGLDGLGLRP